MPFYVKKTKAITKISFTKPNPLHNKPDIQKVRREQSNPYNHFKRGYKKLIGKKQ